MPHCRRAGSAAAASRPCGMSRASRAVSMASCRVVRASSASRSASRCVPPTDAGVTFESVRARERRGARALRPRSRRSRRRAGSRRRASASARARCARSTARCCRGCARSVSSGRSSRGIGDRDVGYILGAVMGGEYRGLQFSYDDELVAVRHRRLAPVSPGRRAVRRRRRALRPRHRDGLQAAVGRGHHGDRDARARPLTAARRGFGSCGSDLRAIARRDRDARMPGR